MNKRIVIIMFVGVLILMSVIGFLIWNNRTVSTITIDINPSIEINLDKNEKVKSIIALNDDAKEIINDDMKGKSLEELFSLMIINLIDKKYTKDNNNLDIILHVDGNVKSEKVAEQIEFEFGKKDVHSEIIIIENITKEDEDAAKKYNISPAKASYINSIAKENENVNIDNLANKSITELNKTKTTGKYCDKDYILDGDFCYKEIERVAAIYGEICPTGYYEKNDKCYDQIQPIDTGNYICNDEFKLVDDKCVLEDTYNALGKCDSGKYDNGYCITEEYYGDAKEYCRITPETDLLYNGRCLGRKPTMNGGCLGNDKKINGYCYDTSPSSGYKADWVCPDGAFITNPDGSLMHEDKKCYKETKTKPSSYYCNDDDILNGTKCEFTKIEDAEKVKECPSGYKMVDRNRCINYNKVVNKTNGYYCEMETARLNEKTCIIYDIVEAKS